MFHNLNNTGSTFIFVLLWHIKLGDSAESSFDNIYSMIISSSLNSSNNNKTKQKVQKSDHTGPLRAKHFASHILRY